jgi:hypothetical protein
VVAFAVPQNPVRKTTQGWATRPSNEQVCKDFVQCLAQLAGTGATYETEWSKEKTGSDVVVKIMPRSEEASPIEARLELDFGVYLLFGVSAQF